MYCFNVCELTNLITLTTDYGANGPYPAMLRARFFQARPGIQLIDITHNISKFNIREAAYVLKNCFSFYPEGSLHLVDVSSDQLRSRDFILFDFQKHHFLVPDNGIVSLITDNAYLEVRRLTTDSHAPGGFDLLSHILPQLLAKNSWQAAEFGEIKDDYLQFTPIFPAVQGNRMQGNVQYIDSYGNVITNIDRLFFSRYVQGQPTIYLKRSHRGGDVIREIVQHYGDVPAGEIACFFGHNNFMQIAIHGGNAAQLLGLQVDDPILIEIA